MRHEYPRVLSRAAPLLILPNVLLRALSNCPTDPADYVVEHVGKAVDQVLGLEETR